MTRGFLDFIGSAKSLRRFLLLLLGWRLSLGLISVAFPLGGPHQWRQSDTMGVAMRFWSRWAIEADSSYPLLAAVIQSGDSRGITAAELPLLPMLAAPSFALGPDQGRRGAQAVLLCLVVGLIALNWRIWRSVVVFGIEAADVVLLTPVFSFAAPFLTKFIPDLLAMLLCLAALGLVAKGRSLGWAIVLATVGLLLKPTSIVTVFPLLLVANQWRKLRPTQLFLVVPFLTAAWFYGPFSSWVDSLRDGRNIFRMSLSPPWTNVQSILSDLDSLGSCLNYHLFFPFGFLIGGLFLGKGYLKIHREKQVPFKRSTGLAKNVGIWGLLCIVVLQIAFVLLADGNHAFTHVYYFMGVAPVAASIFLLVWRRLFPWPPLRILLLLFLLGRNFEIGATEVSTILRPGGIKEFFEECTQLRLSHPEVPWGRGLTFRSPGEEYSLLGLCFGERVMSATAEWGFVELKNLPLIPPECVIVEQREHVGLIRCK